MILETERLELRELTEDDLDALQRVLGDAVAMVHYPRAFTLEMTADWIRWSRDNYARHGFGLWAMVEKASGQLIGDCGLTIQLVDGVDEIEIGYHLRRDRWGLGLATEAAKGCRDYVFDVLGRDRVISWMGPANLPSRRVAERVGMKLEKQTRNRFGKDAVVYAMGRADR